MLGALLPSSVVVQETRALPQALDLYPEELEVVAGAVDKRRQEFAAVRQCARRALAQLGHPPAPLLPGERGAPQWPAGIVGSMTHCAGFAAAALTRATDLASLGIDAEPHEALPDGVLEAIALPQERAMVSRLSGERPSACWDRLLFCAKEAVYKAWFPLTGKWLGFEDALIDVRPLSPVPVTATASLRGTFSARLLVPGPVVGGDRIGEFAGHWRVSDGLLAAAIAVPHARRSGRAGIPAE
ncbi:4'-phosphopantetheinyl transferase [Streptomyces fodineus]|uniref:4'-phosphopantetheinyl transferase n=1 Tax=Streptomyces fodineus TaxID=1904616 RepID=A0A1D7YP56_9ACTN|nr:4'-phosphopantetheinyl transferase superfamily protein [Streptomyces fodineus]AOR37351.1 4'-phosphopantetheinyl transferase [Streptomyces fodineus]